MKEKVRQEIKDKGGEEIDVMLNLEVSCGGFLASFLWLHLLPGARVVNGFVSGSNILRIRWFESNPSCGCGHIQRG